jgi:hypothetical protein
MTLFDRFQGVVVAWVFNIYSAGNRVLAPNVSVVHEITGL